MFATWWRRSVKYQTMHCAWSNSQCVNYKRFTPSGWKAIGIQILEWEITTENNSWIEIKLWSRSFVHLPISKIKRSSRFCVKIKSFQREYRDQTIEIMGTQHISFQRGYRDQTIVIMGTQHKSSQLRYK